MCKKLLQILIIFGVSIAINAELPICMRRSTYFLDPNDKYILTKANSVVYFENYQKVINSNDTEHTLKLSIRQDVQEIHLEIFVSDLKGFIQFQFVISRKLINLNQHQLEDLKCNQNESFYGTYLIVNGTFDDLITKQGCKIYNECGYLEVETVTIILFQDYIVVDEKFYINRVIKELFQLNNITFDHFFLTTSFCMFSEVKSYVKNEQDKVRQRSKQIRIFLMFLVMIPVAVVIITCSNKCIRNNRIVST
ncbi:unnamed protein product [Diamesa hyperborea]